MAHWDLDRISWGRPDRRSVDGVALHLYHMTAEKRASTAIAVLQDWARALNEKSLIEGAYLLGSLIYRDGSQFGEYSDVDLVLALTDEQAPTRRFSILQSVQTSKKQLELNLREEATQATHSAVL